MKFISRPITALALAALFGVGLMAPVRAEPITSTATLHYVTGGAERELRSNTTVLTPTPTETASVATFLRPTTTPDAKAIPVAGAQCRLASGAYQPLSNETGEVTTSAIPSTNFHAGENLYFSVEDGDRNANATVLDEVEVTVTAGEGDREIIRMLETGPNTGVFAGQLPTQVGAIATPYNCVLTVTAGSGVKLSYGDTRHREDVSQVQALIDPFGVTFDSETGEALNGVRVTLIDDATSQPAAVFGDDGVSAYPSSMLSGETVRDAGGTIYAGVKGSYRFPLVASGRYRLLVEPTEGWRAPSEADPASLAQLDAPSGDKYQIDAPSFGAAFNLVGPAPLRVDLPLDPVRTGLLLDKSASVSEASVGDFVQYRLTLENPNTRGALAGARIRDELPQGVRLQPGSVRIDGKPGSATVSGDTLDISVGALRGGAKVQIAYVVRLEPSVRNGLLVTRANAATAIGLTSNEARATVRVTPPLMAGVLTLIGRVT